MFLFSLIRERNLFMLNSQKLLFFIVLLPEVFVFSADQENPIFYRPDKDEFHNGDTRGEHKRSLFEKFRSPKNGKSSPPTSPRSEKKSSVPKTESLLSLLVQDLIEAQGQKKNP